jgi:mono/diheme cytochrome c family protein
MTSMRLHDPWELTPARLPYSLPLSLMLISICSFQAQAAPDNSYEETVGSLLSQNCLSCHNDKTRTSGLSVATKADLLAGGARRGATIEPGKPEESVLIKVLRGQLEPRMPAGGAPLPEDKIQIIANWIKTLQPAEISAAPSSTGWWAFKPAQIPSLPKVENAAWVRNGIDNFVLRKLEGNGLAPAPEAPRQMLLRRVFFDLIGLPPTPAEADAFLQDKSADAYEKLIDRLLADPRYGERWGRHWLDLARYADSQGFEGDPELSHAWRFRDYVIDSFNKDKPYDRFVKEQIAGDELGVQVAEDDDDDAPRRRRAGSPEGQIGLGFLRLGPRTPNVSSIESRQMILDEMTATVSSVFLGLTVKCAQCHDHKYDPIPQKDYYRLQAFFAPIELLDARVEFADPAMRARMEARRADFAAQLKSADDNFKEYQGKMMAKLADVLRAQPDSKAQATLPELTKRLIREDAGNLTASQDKTFTEEEKEHYLDLLNLVDTRNVGIGLRRRQVARYEPVAHSARNASASPLAPNRPVTHLLIGGQFDKLGEAVEPGFLSAVTGNSDPATLPTVGFGNVSKWRSVLADWIANPANPLTSRVMVNRIWQEHFGAGIVSTSSDFGKNGARPTHPELLDWLAVQFVEKAWSMKAMHRLIMTSSTYRQNSEHSTEAAVKLDPSNMLLWRMNRQRLEGESLRDSILAVSGRLNPERGGPGIFPKLPDELANLRIKNRVVWEPENGAEALKRSVYIMQRRQLQVPFLNVMDAPALNESCPVRAVSTTAVQALSMMNGELVTEEAKHFADRVSETAGPDEGDRIRLAFRLALARPPEPGELQKARDFLHSGGDLTGLCRILVNTNEFAYVR